MGWFDWFRRRPRRDVASAPMAAAPVPAESAAPASPEGLWRVGIDADLLWAIDPNERRASVEIPRLTGVAIETNDSGPVGTDLWWLFYGPDEDVACAFPLGAAGEGPVVERIAALPGFRHDAYAAAIRSTDIDTFVIWQPALD